MKDAKAQILVNLARLSSGYALTHVSRFLPELVAMRPDDSFVAVVPAEFAGIVESWGTTVCTSPTALGGLRSQLPWERVSRRTTGRRPDVILGPLSHVPVLSRAPQMVWACQLPAGGATGERPEARGLAAWRVSMPRSCFVVYPSAAARRVAEMPAFRAPGLILRPPLREVPPSAEEGPRERNFSESLRVLVPAYDQPGRNLALLRRLSSVLAARDVNHHIWVTGDIPSDVTSTHVSGGFAYDRERLWELRDRVDVVLVPALGQSCCSSLVEFERLGFPVAASSAEAHVEMRDCARLFDPASPQGAADALLDAVEDGRREVDRSVDPDWRYNTPHGFAAALSAELDRLIDAEALPWAE